MPDTPAAEVEVRTLALEADDGVRLEADLATPSGPGLPWAAVVLCHPHPQFGGDRWSLVTSELFRLLPAEGVLSLRFDFRGAGGSGGEHSGGEGERLDVQAAVDHLAPLAPPGGPLVLAGWSFGSDLALSCTDERLAGWFALAPPLRFGAFDAASADPRPKLLAVPEHDQLTPPEVVRERAEGWANTEQVVVEGADHLCAGRTTRVHELLSTFLRSLS